MVFQNYALYPHMSVFDNMAYGLKIAEGAQGRDQDGGSTRPRRSWSSATCWSASRASSPAGSASAWPWAAPSCAQPQVFLFDEPLSNLDAKLRAQTRLEIQKLHRELGITSLFVTHDQVEAMTLAQRIIVMNGGVMDQFATPEEVYARPATTFVASFIGSPPMNLLKAAPGVRPGHILGIRPEHLDLDDAGWSVQVESIELLGAERLIYGRIGDEPIIMRADEGQRAPAVGDTVRMAARRTGCTGSTPARASGVGLSDGVTAPGPTRAGSRTAAPARWRRRTRWRPSGWARTHGYRMFECDVKLSADGVPFLLHDATLERTTDGAGQRRRAALGRTGAARRRRLAFARAMQASRWPAWSSGAFLPGQRPFLNIEIKPTPGTERATGAAVAQHAARLWAGAAVPPLLTSFQPEALHARARRATGAAARPAAGHAARRLAGDARRRSAASPWSATTRCGMPAVLADARAAGLRALSYTVNDESAAERLLALGTDGIITDRVDRFDPAR